MSQADIEQHIRNNCDDASESTIVQVAAAIWNWSKDTAAEEITAYAIKRLLMGAGLASVGAEYASALIASLLLDSEDAY
jgi:hypothetical protein